MVSTVGGTGRLAVWQHSTAVWDRLRSDVDENGVFTGSLRAIFQELDCIPHRPRVIKALKLMGRIEIVSYGPNKETIIQLKMPEAELSIHEFEKVLTEIQSSKVQRKQTADWLTDQRILDLARTVSELLMKVDAIERRLDNRPPLDPFGSSEESLIEDEEEDEIFISYGED